MSTSRRFTAIAAILSCLPLLSHAQKNWQSPPPPGSAFYSYQKPDHPPFPVNLFPDLPFYQVEPWVYVIDDRSVDYSSSSTMTTSSSEEPPVPGPGGGEPQQPPYIAPTVPIPGVPLLKIELTTDNAKIVSFSSETNVPYRIEQSPDLAIWTLLDEIVATDTNSYFYVFDEDIRFYRVIKGDDRIQFPDWEDFIEQFLYFDVWTSMSGTYHLELYTNGTLTYSRDAVVPPDGFFGVYDNNYDPNQWPYTGYYTGVDEWELRVTVTEPAGSGGGGGGAASATVKKKQRRRNQNRVGITVQQYKAFTISFLVQEEIDTWMHNYFLANFQASRQVGLSGADLNEFISAEEVPRLLDTNSWTALRNLLVNGSLTDLHYFGHGTNTLFGGRAQGEQITLEQIKSSMLRTFPMRYVGLDGCRTSKTTDFLKAFVGQGKKMSRQTFINNGWDPVFAWGWKDDKTVGYERQGELYDPHFWFVADYYWFLTLRDFGGYMQNTYERAITYGQYPGGDGSPASPLGHGKDRNTEGDSINFVGCRDCVFDLP